MTYVYIYICIYLFFRISISRKIRALGMGFGGILGGSKINVVEGFLKGTIGLGFIRGRPISLATCVDVPILHMFDPTDPELCLPKRQQAAASSHQVLP